MVPAPLLCHHYPLLYDVTTFSTIPSLSPPLRHHYFLYYTVTTLSRHYLLHYDVTTFSCITNLSIMTSLPSPLWRHYPPYMTPLTPLCRHYSLLYNATNISVTIPFIMMSCHTSSFLWRRPFFYNFTAPFTMTLLHPPLWRHYPSIMTSLPLHYVITYPSLH